MPRVTKKQKEAGKTAKPKPKVRSGGNVGGGKKSGFQVKPSRAPKDAYMGKAQKIKADLIERAKMKKSYAKILKSEGMDSSRLGDGSRRRNERPQADEGPSSSYNNSKGKGRAVGKGEEEQQRLESRAGPAPGSGTVLGESSSGPPHRLNRSKSNNSFRDKPPHHNNRRRPQKDSSPPPVKKVRALSISPPPPPTANPSNEQQIQKKSFREKKKEAFSKYHKPREATTSSSIGGRNGSVKRGQPNMGARMGLLLEKIKSNVK